MADPCHSFLVAMTSRPSSGVPIPILLWLCECSLAEFIGIRKKGECDVESMCLTGGGALAPVYALSGGLSPIYPGQQNALTHHFMLLPSSSSALHP